MVRGAEGCRFSSAGADPGGGVGASADLLDAEGQTLRR